MECFALKAIFKKFGSKKMKEVLYCDNRGQLFTYREAMEIFRNKYDGKDPLNSVPFEEYFTRVEF